MATVSKPKYPKRQSRPRHKNILTTPNTIAENVLVPPPQPYAIPYPKDKERCAWSGYSRAMLVALTVPLKRNKFSPPVQSVSLKRPGQKHGSRLIVLQSLLDYMREHTEGGQRAA